MGKKGVWVDNGQSVAAIEIKNIYTCTLYIQLVIKMQKETNIISN